MFNTVIEIEAQSKLLAAQQAVHQLNAEEHDDNICYELHYDRREIEVQDLSGEDDPVYRDFEIEKQEGTPDYAGNEWYTVTINPVH